VAISAFVGLASEFFWHLLARRPLPGRPAALTRIESSDIEMKASRGDVYKTDTAGSLGLYSRLALVGLGLSTTLLFIRCAKVLGGCLSGRFNGAVPRRSIYRTAELADGEVYAIITVDSAQLTVIMSRLARRHHGYSDLLQFVFSMSCDNPLRADRAMISQQTYSTG
jgi:hypothetical protein